MRDKKEGEGLRRPHSSSQGRSSRSSSGGVRDRRKMGRSSRQRHQSHRHRSNGKKSSSRSSRRRQREHSGADESSVHTAEKVGSARKSEKAGKSPHVSERFLASSSKTRKHRRRTGEVNNRTGSLSSSHGSGDWVPRKAHLHSNHHTGSRKHRRGTGESIGEEQHREAAAEAGKKPRSSSRSRQEPRRQQAEEDDAVGNARSSRLLRRRSRSSSTGKEAEDEEGAGARKPRSRHMQQVKRRNSSEKNGSGAVWRRRRSRRSGSRDLAAPHIASAADGLPPGVSSSTRRYPAADAGCKGHSKNQVKESSSPTDSTSHAPTNSQHQARRLVSHSRGASSEAAKNSCNHRPGTATNDETASHTARHSATQRKEDTTTSTAATADILGNRVSSSSREPSAAAEDGSQPHSPISPSRHQLRRLSRESGRSSRGERRRKKMSKTGQQRLKESGSDHNKRRLSSTQRRGSRDFFQPSRRSTSRAETSHGSRRRRPDQRRSSVRSRSPRREGSSRVSRKRRSSRGHYYSPVVGAAGADLSSTAATAAASIRKLAARAAAAAACSPSLAEMSTRRVRDDHHQHRNKSGRDSGPRMHALKPYADSHHERHHHPHHYSQTTRHDSPPPPHSSRSREQRLPPPPSHVSEQHMQQQQPIMCRSWGRPPTTTTAAPPVLAPAWREADDEKRAPLSTAPPPAAGRAGGGPLRFPAGVPVAVYSGNWANRDLRSHNSSSSHMNNHMSSRENSGFFDFPLPAPYKVLQPPSSARLFLGRAPQLPSVRMQSPPPAFFEQRLLMRRKLAEEAMLIDQRREKKRALRRTLKPALVVDRERTPPFLLRVFYKVDDQHRIEQFQQRGQEPVEDELQVYAWLDSKLREIAYLVKDVCWEARDRQAVWRFRLVYPDKTGKNVIANIGLLHSTIPDAKEDNKSLADVKFQIGDFLLLSIVKEKDDTYKILPRKEAPHTRTTEDGWEEVVQQPDGGELPIASSRPPASSGAAILHVDSSAPSSASQLEFQNCEEGEAAEQTHRAQPQQRQLDNSSNHCSNSSSSSSAEKSSSSDDRSCSSSDEKTGNGDQGAGEAAGGMIGQGPQADEEAVVGERENTFLEECKSEGEDEDDVEREIFQDRERYEATDKQTDDEEDVEDKTIDGDEDALKAANAVSS